MAVSPWFYTNLPGYGKNWLWRGDSLWYDRWMEVLFLQPEFVEVLSWNDYGESHYVGAIRDNDVLGADNGDAPFDYLTGMSHQGFYKSLKYWIQMYKNGYSTIEESLLIVWYRSQLGTACDSGGTSGNTASQLQIEYEPYDIMQDNIYFNALLLEETTVTVTIGGVAIAGEWSSRPYGGIGMYNGSVAIGGRTGAVVVTLGNGLSYSGGPDVTTDCSAYDGYNNWNVQTGWSSGAASGVTLGDASAMNCTKGWGKGNFLGLCDFGCAYGYCPEGACVCTELGVLTEDDLPDPTGVIGYPAEGQGSSLLGLCAFDCNYGYCPDTACGTVSYTLVEATVSPFTPDAPTGGTDNGDPNYSGLCSYACAYGYCPISKCTTSATGALVDAPSISDSWTGEPLDTTDTSGLCEWACERTYCPSGACENTTATDTGTGTGLGLTGASTSSTKKILSAEIGECSDGGDFEFRCLLCSSETDREGVSLQYTPPIKWSNALAQASIGTFNTWYKDAVANDDFAGTDIKTWGAALSYFYDSTVALNCVVGGDDGTNVNCDSDLACDGEVYTLAGSLVMSSFVRIFLFYESWWSALDDTYSDWSGIKDDFKDAFVYEGDTILAELNEWLFDTLLDSATGMLWSRYGGSLSLPSDDEEEDGSPVSDLASAAYDEAYTQVTDKIKSQIDFGGGGSDDTDLGALATQIIQDQKYAIGNYSEWLLGGSDDAVEEFASQVRYGTWLQMTNTTVDETRSRVKKMSIARLLPYAWNQNGMWPVIVAAPEGDDTPKFRSTPYYGLSLDSDKVEAASVNYDGKTFWLLGMVDCTSYSEKDYACRSTEWSLLNGYDQLDGDHAEWGNLNIEELVTSAWEGYKLNEYANGYNITSTDGASHYLDGSGSTSKYDYVNGVMTPGFVSIPICSFDLATINWDETSNTGQTQDKYKCATYPCCSCEFYGASGCDEEDLS